MTETESPRWTEGFVLSATTKPSSKGDSVDLWCVTPTGTQRFTSSPEQHVAFGKESDFQMLATLAKTHSVSLYSSHLKTFTHQSVVVLKCKRQREFRQLLQACHDKGIEVFESDVKLTDRFLMERFIYGSIDLLGSPPQRVKPGHYRPTLSYVSFDIECNEHGHLYSIGCDMQGNGTVWMIDETANNLNCEGFNYIPVNNETELLKAWSNYICEQDPDVLVGWNVKQFDCSVLFTRANELGITLNIGREGSALNVRKGNTDQVWVEVAGRAVVDGIESLKTMTLHFDNYSLQNVANEILGKGKLIYEADQLEHIKTLFLEDKRTLATYNFQDCRLVTDIIEKTQLLDFLVLRSCLTGLSISRPGGSVAAFINTYLPHVHRAGYIAPNRPADGGLASPGGYVMTSIPGLYKHVVLLDFKSLYPSIIRTFLIDPVGLVEGLKTPESSIPGFKDAQFSRETHFLPAIIDQLWQQRDQAKRDKDGPRSQAIKIIMNSFYGVLGSGGCPFYDTRLASSITLRGHEIMQKTKIEIESLGYKVIYGDTDSTFVWLEHCDNDEEAMDIGQTLANHVNAFWRNEVKQSFNTECYLEMEFETHFQQFFMPTIRNSEQGSKKRYVGLPSPTFGNSLIFKGMESVRSDWTALAKAFQTELYRRIFAELPVNDFIRQTIDDVLSGQRDTELVYRKRLKKPVESYTKTRPPHVKAAAIANDIALKDGKSIPYKAKSYVEYVITVNGPVPLEYANSLDYTHYIEKQIKPIADSILPHIGSDFSLIATGQLTLF